MSDEGNAALIGLVVFIALLLIPLIVIGIIRYTKKSSKKKTDMPREEDDSLFSTTHDNIDVKSTIIDENGDVNTVIIYKYGSKVKEFKSCLYCGVDNDVSSNICCVCGNKLD